MASRTPFESDVPYDHGIPAAACIDLKWRLKFGDERALRIYESVGVFFGYAIAHYADFYEFRNLLALGRVMSGEGGNLILETSRRVLKDEFPEPLLLFYINHLGWELGAEQQAYAIKALAQAAGNKAAEDAIDPVLPKKIVDGVKVDAFMKALVDVRAKIAK